MASRQDPAPFLARVPAGAIRDSLDLLWRKLALITSAQAPLTRDTAPQLFLTLSGNISLADSTPTVVTWGTLAYAGGGGKAMWTSSSPTRATLPRDIPTGTVWLLKAHAQFAASAAGRRIVEIRYNDSSGVTLISSTILPPVAAVSTRIETSQFLLDPAPGVFLDVSVEQTSGGALDLEADQTSFSLTRLF